MEEDGTEVDSDTFEVITNQVLIIGQKWSSPPTGAIENQASGSSFTKPTSTAKPDDNSNSLNIGKECNRGVGCVCVGGGGVMQHVLLLLMQFKCLILFHFIKS